MAAERDQMLSHYRLVEKIGEGGMGVVWKAEDTILNRTVAIKALPADVALDEKRRRMFLDEARLAASVSHAHIVQVYELGREGDLDFIVMEYVEGQPLKKLLNGRPLPSDKVAEIGLQVAEGLARAHRKGLIHRDLKPANILVTPNNEVKIVDFGLAVLFEQRDSTVGSFASTLTTTLPEETRTRIAGTLPYMSPEQVRGEKLDARSDIFSFGTVLYEMTTGLRPFTGAKPAEVAQEIQKGQPRPVHELVPKVPLDLHRIIEKALARRPEERFQIIDDAAVDLRRLGRDLETGSAPSYSGFETTKPVPRRRNWRRVLGFTAVAIALGIGSWFAWKKIAGTTAVVIQTNAGSPAKPNWILVAEFEGPPDNPDLAVATRELVIAALGQSTVVTPIMRSDLQRGLALAMKPDTTRVIGNVAQELAYRAGARAYVEGRVDRILRGYSIILRVLTADDGQLVTSVSATAENDAVLISTIDGLVRELRERLGEHKRSLQATRPLTEAITPYLGAYQLYVRAFEEQGEGDFVSSNKTFRQALTSDPDFAGAWLIMGGNYTNLGLLDSAQAAWQEARRRPERLTERQLLLLQGLIAQVIQCDYPDALRLYDLAINRGYFGAHNNRGVVLSQLGRHEEALEAFVRFGELGAFGQPQIAHNNQFNQLLVLGRHDAALDMLSRLRGSRERELTYYLATLASAKAESLATVLTRDPEATPAVRHNAELVLASRYAARGACENMVRELARIAADAPDQVSAHEACLSLMYARLMCRGTVEINYPETCHDTTAAGLIVQGIGAAVHGDTLAARRALHAIANKGTPERRRYAVDTRLLEAWIAFGEHQWDKVIRLLEPTTTSGQEPWLTGRLSIRWLVAEAHEQSGNLKDAAASFEQVLSPVGLQMDYDPEKRVIFYSFAHQRLVLLYSRMGQVADSRRHWEIFKQTFTDPDPELRPMIEEAREALAVAESKP